MKNIEDYVDSYDMVVTKPGDGGDSCAHGMAIIYAEFIALGNVYPHDVNYMGKLEKAPGRYVRHPDPNMWYSDLDRLSRDQMIPLLAYIGIAGFQQRRARLFKEHLKHGLLFTWNTRRNGATKENDGTRIHPLETPTYNYGWKMPDITGPEIWAAWIRAYDIQILYPLLFLFDIETLVNSVIHRYFPHTDIQMNHVVMVDFSTRKMPTLVSKLARWVYGKKVARWALNNKWGGLDWEPPVNQYLVPLVESWPVRE